MPASMKFWRTHKLAHLKIVIMNNKQATEVKVELIDWTCWGKSEFKLTYFFNINIIKETIL